MEAQFIPSSIGLFSICRESWTTMDYWSWMVEHGRADELDIAIIILWSIWNIRNRALAQNLCVDPNKLLISIQVSIQSAIKEKLEAIQEKLTYNKPRN